MTDLTVFSYSDIEIRTVVRDGEPWFVAADVCKILGLTNPTMALRALDEDEKGLSQIETPGGAQNMAVVNESGMYALIVRSDKPNAKPFRKWVTSEVLPAIRKTGRYEVAPASVASIGRRELAQMVIEAEDRASLAEQALAEVAPAAEAWNHLATAAGDYAVADAAKILSRHPLITIGRDRLFTLMYRERWIYRRVLDSRWAVLQYAVDRGWLSELASSHYHPRSGELVLDPPQVRVTVKGLAELQKRLTGTQGEIEAA
jgi:anti-repressor protein